MGPSAPSTGLATAAMTCGLIAIPCACCCGIGVPLGIAGAVMGAIAMSKASSSPETHGGKGKALAGVICGSIGLVLSVLWLILVGFFTAAMQNHR